MKKLSLLLSAIMLITATACTTSNSSNETQTSETTQPQTSKSLESVAINQEQSEPSIQEDPFETAGMPQPFEHMGGDANRQFSDRYTLKFYNTSLISDEIVKYLGLSDEEFSNTYLEIFPDGGDYWSHVISTSGVMESPSLPWVIIEFNIPDNVIIAAIEKSNEYHTNLYNEAYIKFYQYDDELDALAREQLADTVFTQEDVTALLSRDEEIITAHFAETTAIVIEDRAYSPAWLYLNKLENYEKAGITPEMLEEKLDVYAEFGLTNQADEAFSKKLSEFTGKKVSLKQRRAENKNNQVNRKRQ